MQRIVFALVAFGILGLTANQALAHDWYGPNYHHPGYAHHCGQVYVRPTVVVVPARPLPTVVYAPRTYGYCAPAPRTGFYYRGSGISIGIGF